MGQIPIAYVLAGLLLVASACGGKDKQERSAFTDAQGRMFIDSQLTERELQFLKTDFQKLHDWQLSEYSDVQPTLSRAYETLFGSTHASPEPYFFERVKALLSVNRANPDRDERIVASNDGVALWLDQMLRDPHHPETFILGGYSFTLDSSRVGIVVLGKGYSAVDSAVFRVSTLLHEGRHSDCPEGLTDSQIDRLRVATSENISEALGTCGFPHTVCTEGELEGLPACEKPEGWGAYSVEAVFAKGLYQACTNCTETEKQHALVTFIDSVERVTSWKGMSEGRFGLPDMRQQGYRGP